MANHALNAAIVDQQSGDKELVIPGDCVVLERGLKQRCGANESRSCRRQTMFGFFFHSAKKDERRCARPPRGSRDSPSAPGGSTLRGLPSRRLPRRPDRRANRLPRWCRRHVRRDCRRDGRPPAAPPSAETVWLRIGYTFETNRDAEARIRFRKRRWRARRPAPPAPTSRTSCEETSSIMAAGPNHTLTRRRFQAEFVRSREAIVVGIDYEAPREYNVPELGGVSPETQKGRRVWEQHCTPGNSRSCLTATQDQYEIVECADGVEGIAQLNEKYPASFRVDDRG